MRYTEVEIRPSYRQVVYWSENKIHEFYQERGFTDQEIWQYNMYKGPRSILLHTGRFVSDKWVEGINIHFDLGKRKDETQEKGELKIWNISSEVLFYIEVGCEITVKSGYLDHYDTIFKGEISEVNTSREDGDEATLIKCKGVSDILSDKKVNSLSFVMDDKFSYLMNTILAEIGYTAVYVGLDVNYYDICKEGERTIYDNGMVWEYGYVGSSPGITAGSYPVKELLDRAMLQTNNYFYWCTINGRIYFIRKGYSLPAFVRLTPLTGLLKYEYKPTATTASPYEDDGEDGPIDPIAVELYEVKCLLIYDIVPNSLVVIQPTLTGDSYLFRIRECDYLSDADEHKIEFVCEKIGIFNQSPLYARRVQSGYGRLIAERVGPGSMAVG